MLHTLHNTPLDTFKYFDKGHGRQVSRSVELYVNTAQLPKGWNGIQRLIKVKRWGTRKNKPFEETAFYVLSKPINSAEAVAYAIQQHWSIENKLHWVKDVNIGEDKMTLNGANLVSVLVYLNNTAINILQKAGYKPVKNTFAKIANKVNELHKLFISHGEI